MIMTIPKQLLEAKICNKNTCELQARINKAIEYIKQYGKLYCLKGKQFKDYQQYQDLLDILKGEQNDSNSASN